MRRKRYLIITLIEFTDFLINIFSLSVYRFGVCEFVYAFLELQTTGRFRIWLMTDENNNHHEI